uniref:Tpd52 like 2a n=1 Tax=Oncorhynchus tshawytscha TaxID=74940 RepID=A0AAZ3SB72_ONCTS
MPLLIMNRQGYSGENVSPRNISIGISGIGSPTNGLSEEDEFDLKMELAKTEDEIQTLRQVLLAKEKYAMDIRRQLGTGPFSEIKQNLSKGWQEVQTSNAYLTASATLEDISQSNVYKRTQESISNAGQMTSAALSTVGVAITRRLGDMRYPQLILLHTLLFFPSSFTTSITHLSTSSVHPSYRHFVLIH